MKQYSIALPNEKANTYGYVTLFILLTSLCVFIVVYFNRYDGQIKNISLCGIVLSFISLIIFLTDRHLKQIRFFRIELLYFILSVCWFLLGIYLLSLCFVCFAVIVRYAGRKSEILFTREWIIYPSFPKKTFLWKDVSNVILKDNMLTIDLKNNKLIQVIIGNVSAEVINEKEFNLFCEARLKSW